MRILFFTLIFSFQFAQAQSNDFSKAQKDSLRLAQLEKNKIFPLIVKSGGVIPVEANYQPDKKREYKILFDLYFGRYDSVNVRKMNSSLTAMARIINLHAASGIPKDKMTIIAVVHNTGLDAFFTNEKYREKYGVDNPSLLLIGEFLDLGIQFVACGQTIEMNGNFAPDFIPQLKIAVSALPVITEYVGKGFVKY